MMFGILKKDIALYVLYLLVAMAGPTLLIVLDGMDWGTVVMMGGLMLMLVSGLSAANEQIEDKYHGYVFLRTLPITTGQIVKGKFILPLVFGILYAVYALVMVSRYAPSPAILTLGRAYILACAHLGLFLAALLYIGAYRFGYASVFRLVLMGLPMAVFLIPVGLFVLFRDDLYRLDPTSIIVFAGAVNWLPVTVCGIALYVGLMLVAIKVKNAHLV